MRSGVEAVVPLIETTRGELVESVHCGAVAAVDACGALVWAAGDPTLVTFPSSSLKPLQLLAFIEHGGAEWFQLQPDEIAILAGSHGGEPMHLNRVSSVLEKSARQRKRSPVAPTLRSTRKPLPICAPAEPSPVPSTTTVPANTLACSHSPSCLAHR